LNIINYKTYTYTGTVLCVMFCRLLLVLLSVFCGHCIVCSSSIQILITPLASSNFSSYMSIGKRMIKSNNNKNWRCWLHHEKHRIPIKMNFKQITRVNVNCIQYILYHALCIRSLISTNKELRYHYPVYNGAYSYIPLQPLNNVLWNTMAHLACGH
jgi:hypothetical protein